MIANDRKTNSFTLVGIHFHESQWRRWIFVAVLVLIFFTMVCIILAYVLKQTEIYEETMSLLNEMKSKLDKCCLKNEKRNETTIGNEEMKQK